ncbi:hypothetical protein BGZ83_001321, partial [Gryganskiella cystojenkinii]
RTIQTLEQYLRVFIDKDHKNWDELLDQAEFSYNSNKSASTNLSSFEAMNGFQPLTLVSIALARSNNSALTSSETLSWMPKDEWPASMTDTERTLPSW